MWLVLFGRGQEWRTRMRGRENEAVEEYDKTRREE